METASDPLPRKPKTVRRGRAHRLRGIPAKTRPPRKRTQGLGWQLQKPPAYRPAVRSPTSRYGAASMPPLPLTDEQLDAVMRAAAPLQPRDRDPFLRDVANALQGHEIGPGLLHRIVCECQRKYWDPPIDGTAGVGKYGR